MIFPKSVTKGDTIGVIAPAGPYREKTIEEIEETLKCYGYKAKFGKSCYSSYKGYLADTDEIRAKDIEEMFLDQEVDGILCIRGGYGTLRILDSIDYNIIKNNPKAFIGFSDITALHIAFNQKAELVTFHGIMAGSCYRWDEFTFNSLVDALEMGDSLELVNPEGEELITLVDGQCEGQIIGGNLSLIAATMGTEFEIDAKGKILLIEDVGESIYKIDRMLTQLALAGKFDECVGIIFGDFCDCNKENDGDFELEELLYDRVRKYKKPCILNLKSGHCMPMISIPLGVDCKLNATFKKIILYK